MTRFIKQHITSLTNQFSTVHFSSPDVKCMFLFSPLWSGKNVYKYIKKPEKASSQQKGIKFINYQSDVTTYANMIKKSPLKHPERINLLKKSQKLI